MTKGRRNSRGPSGGHARRSSFRRPYIVRLPQESQPRPKRRSRAPQLFQEALCIAPARRKLAAAQAAATCAATPGGFVNESQAQGKRRPRAPQLRERLCVVRLPHESQPQPKRRPRAPQLLQEALCTALATRKPAAVQAAVTRAAAPPGGSV